LEQPPVALVVDDEPHILSFLEENLRSDDYEVITATSVAQARSKLNARQPDIILLDVMLGEFSGFDFCREIREMDPVTSRTNPETPVIMLTARGDDADRVRGFQRGADDYVVKPFAYQELLARMGAVLRRSRVVRERDVISVAGLDIDAVTCEVTLNGVLIELSAKEFLLLTVLAREPRRVFRKQELLEIVWGYRAAGATRTLDSHVSRLRKKLREHATGREYIANVWGVGYRLVGAEFTGS
jgi:DNA-binding response OmpR family regulator